MVMRKNWPDVKPYAANSPNRLQLRIFSSSSLETGTLYPDHTNPLLIVFGMLIQRRLFL